MYSAAPYPSDGEQVYSNPHVLVAVIMRRERVQGAMSQWQSWRWTLHDVVGHDQQPHEAHFGTTARCLSRTDDEELWLHPGFTVSLFIFMRQFFFLGLGSFAFYWAFKVQGAV